MRKMNRYDQAAKLSRPHRPAMNTHALRCSIEVFNMIVSFQNKYLAGIVVALFQIGGGL